MNAEQAENNFKSYLRHIRFWEGREGWPHFTDEEIRAAYEQRCRTAGLLSQESRRRKPSADEVVQGLPVLIAKDMKRLAGKPPAGVQTPMRRSAPVAVPGQKRPDDIKA